MFFKSKKDRLANAIPDVDAIDAKERASKSSPPPSSVVKPPEHAPAPSFPPPAPSTPLDPPPTTVDLERGAAISKRIEAALGEVVAILMRSEAHQAMTLRDLKQHVLPGVLLGQFSVAEAQSRGNGMTTPVSAVVWANVSPEIESRLLGGGTSAAQLDPSEWNSGAIPWVMIAVGDPQLVHALLDRLLKSTWVGKAPKIRVRGPDGKVSVSKLELKAPETKAPETKAS